MIKEIDIPYFSIPFQAYDSDIPIFNVILRDGEYYFSLFDDKGELIEIVSYKEIKHLIKSKYKNKKNI